MSALESAIMYPETLPVTCTKPSEIYQTESYGYHSASESRMSTRSSVGRYGCVYTASSEAVTAKGLVVILGSASSIIGTGSVYDVYHAERWRKRVEAHVSVHVDIEEVSLEPLDLRSAVEHLTNVRRELNPAVSELSSVLGVSRQAIYKWLSGESTPEPDKLERIRVLSKVADEFHKAGITRAPAMLKMKVFKGHSLMDLVAEGKLTSSHIHSLIAEAQAMDAAYDRYGVTKSQAKPSDDWRTDVSIPGIPE